MTPQRTRPLLPLLCGLLALPGSALAQPADDTPPLDTDVASPPAMDEAPPATAEPPADTIAIEKAPRKGVEGEGIVVEPEWTARQVAGAPPPGLESGRVDEGEGESVFWKIGRAVLFAPRVLFEIGFQPVRGAIYMTERYKLPERYYRYFYNDARTFGITPWLWLDSGEGFSAGGKLIWHPESGERIDAFAGVGGTYSGLYSLTLTSRELGKRLSFQLDGNYRDRTRTPFYGIGNGDEVDTTDMIVNPFVDDTAVETRFAKRTARASLAADVRLVSDLHLRGTGIYKDVEMDPGTRDTPIDEVYATDTLVGFEGYRSTYGELEMRWDSRRNASIWEAREAGQHGWLASGFAGWNSVSEGASFLRYGADLQRIQSLARGPRVLVARLYGEGVSAERDELPFTELPVLGGTRLLRGYDVDRFRDRVALVGSLEYEWDLAKLVMASVFTDVGRTYASVSDIELSGLRCGFGISLEAHSQGSLLARVSFESSIDGGFFARLRFDPITTPRRREDYR